MKRSADSVLSTYRENSNAGNGLLIDPQGRLIACEGATFERPGVKVTGKPRVTRTDLRTGKIQVLADSYDGKREGQDLCGAASQRDGADCPGKLFDAAGSSRIVKPQPPTT